MQIGQIDNIDEIFGHRMEISMEKAGPPKGPKRPWFDGQSREKVKTAQDHLSISRPCDFRLIISALFRQYRVANYQGSGFPQYWFQY